MKAAKRNKTITTFVLLFFALLFFAVIMYQWHLTVLMWVGIVAHGIETGLFIRYLEKQMKSLTYHYNPWTDEYEWKDKE